MVGSLFEAMGFADGEPAQRALQTEPEGSASNQTLTR